jgi:ABC-type transport system substrate-binding protein
MLTVGDKGFEPRLARRWTWSADSLSVAFELDPRARWHDGRPGRAEDVAFPFDLYRDPAVGSPHAVATQGRATITTDEIVLIERVDADGNMVPTTELRGGAQGVRILIPGESK